MSAQSAQAKGGRGRKGRADETLTLLDDHSAEGRRPLPAALAEANDAAPTAASLMVSDERQRRVSYDHKYDEAYEDEWDDSHEVRVRARGRGRGEGEGSP